MKVIEVENLSKQYKLGGIGHGTLSKDFQSFWAKLRGKEDPNSNIFDNNKSEKDDFWALKDISFSVEKGDRLGIIGRNGAGKSTLLKILSRITLPTTGTIKIKGRIASLLEVGTGFHPELSGRDNVYLNGAILGMPKTEIYKKFHEIVEFADISKFIDTPVKRYSSGMYVRLAFAVAAHLEPEILVIDEVLAVGDYSFQKKCLGKMEDLNQKEGRTIIFVSHDMNAVKKICNKSLFLDNGKLFLYSYNIEEVIKLYFYSNLNHENKTRKPYYINSQNLYNNEIFDILEIYLTNMDEKLLETQVKPDDYIFLNIIGNLNKINNALQIGYWLISENNELIYASINTDDNVKNWPSLNLGKNKLSTKLPVELLNEGVYKISIIIILYQIKILIHPNIQELSIYFEVAGTKSDSPYWTVRRDGMVAPKISWSSSIL